MRKKGVVGKFVEFYGYGLARLSRWPTAATIANMAPEYGATCGIFPVDAETLRYLRFTGRPEPLVRLVETYCKEQGLFHDATTPAAVYSDAMELDLGKVEPSLAGPSRPQDRVALGDMKPSFAAALPGMLSKAKPKPANATVHLAVAREIGEGSPDAPPPQPTGPAHANGSYNADKDLHHGSVVIAAITSCTNTSNPSVDRCRRLCWRSKAAEKAPAISVQPWVKTSLTPARRW